MQVDFEQVPDLVAGRKVFLQRGQAYVFKTDVASLVVGHFRCAPHTKSALPACRQLLPSLQQSSSMPASSPDQVFTRP